jgi:hypothetical protein
MSPASQLDLFGTDDQRQLRAENAWLRQRLDNAKVEFRKLRADRDAWKNGHDAVKASWKQACGERDALERRVSGLQSTCDFYKMLLDQHIRWGPTLGVPPLSRPDLTQLIALCHPDKWSQGQPATELAHEITVALNALRARSEVRP